jgi:hypothetical protein
MQKTIILSLAVAALTLQAHADTSMPLPADTAKAKGKSAAELTHQYVKFLRQTATNKVKPIAAKQADHASITRDSAQVDMTKYANVDGTSGAPKKTKKSGGSFRDEFDDFLNETKQEFEDFRQQCNAEFAQFLREAWEEFKGKEPIPEPSVIKPVPAVEAPQPNAIWPFKSRKHKAKAVKDYVPDKQPEPVKPVEVVTDKEEWLEFGYCGTPFRVRIDKRHRLFIPQQWNEDNIADLWEHCSGNLFNNVLHDCLELRAKNRMCDWAYLKMLEQLGEQFCGQGTNEAVFLTAFLYCQSGYKMRFGRSRDGHLHMLYATKSIIYDQPYFTLDNTNFYPLTGKAGDMCITRANFKDSNGMDLYMSAEQILSQKPSEPRVIKARDFQGLQVTVSTNINQLSFYDTYPSSYVGGNVMTRWAMYANTPLEDAVKEQVYPALKQKLAGKSELEQVKMLLNLVQTGLAYKYDDEVWGHDRAFFAEESLFYPYCDCEDRSILFTRLVRDLVGLDAILVFYPGHLASAVNFNDKSARGDYIETDDGRQFYICDPTYMGSWPGMTMPKMNNSEAQYILLKRG